MSVLNQSEIFYGGDYLHKIQPCVQNVGQYFLDKMAKNASKIVQIDPIKKITQTYGELRINTIRCALRMKQNGVKRGDVIMICGRCHINLIVPLFSAMYIGATVNTLHPNYTRSEILLMITLTEPKIIFCDEECTNIMTDIVNEIKLQSEFVTFENDFNLYLMPQDPTEEENFVTERVDVLNDLAFIVCTSGTTGLIKGSTITHNAYYLAVQFHTIVEEGDGPLLYYSPISWISAILFCGMAVWHGESKITCEYDPKLNLEIMAHHNIKWTFMGVPKLMEVVQHPEFPQYSTKIINNLKYIYFGGSVVTVEQIRKYRKIFKNASIFNLYGCTEMSILHSHFDRSKDKDLHLNIKKSVSSGRPFIGTYWKLINPVTGVSVGRNQEAELLVKGPLLTKGYYKDPIATAQGIDQDGWLHTGDVVFVDDDDCLFVIGRLKELVKYRGWQISPNDLEHIIESHPSVENACVIGKPHEIDGDLPLAFVVKKTTAKDITENELIEFVNEQVVDHLKLRGGVIFIDTLPRTANGKIRRNELKRLL